MAKVNWKAEAEAAGLDEATTKNAVEVGKELIKQITMEDVCAAGERHRQEMHGMMQIITEIQKVLKKEKGISFTDSGKALIAVGLAAWATDVIDSNLNKN